MGTNYYVANLPDPDEDGDQLWHIGKQSAGWPWCWADPPDDAIPMKWLRFAATMSHLRVVDEYGKDCGSLFDFVAAQGRQETDHHQPGKCWS